MPFKSALRIWDGLFASGGRVDELVSYVCIALLLRIRHLREWRLNTKYMSNFAKLDECPSNQFSRAITRAS